LGGEFGDKPLKNGCKAGKIVGKTSIFPPFPWRSEDILKKRGVKSGSGELNEIAIRFLL